MPDPRHHADVQAYDLARAAADYPAWDGPPRRSIVICTQQRTGSTLLGEAIYFAGGLGCPLEYFNRGFKPRFARRWAADDVRSYVAAVHRHRTDTTGVFAVKLFWDRFMDLVHDLSPEAASAAPAVSAARTADCAYRSAMERVAPVFPRPTFIFLRRKDEVRQAISLAVAAETRRWRLFSRGSDAIPSTRPAIDFDQIVRLLANIQNCNAHWRNFFRANELRPLEVLYEDIDRDYNGTVEALLAQLGRANAQIEPPRLSKQAGASSEALYRQFISEFGKRASG